MTSLYFSSVQLKACFYKIAKQGIFSIIFAIVLCYTSFLLPITFAACFDTNSFIVTKLFVSNAINRLFIRLFHLYTIKVTITLIHYYALRQLFLFSVKWLVYTKKADQIVKEALAFVIWNHFPFYRLPMWAHWKTMYFIKFSFLSQNPSNLTRCIFSFYCSFKRFVSSNILYEMFLIENPRIKLTYLCQ